MAWGDKGWGDGQGPWGGGSPSGRGPSAGGPSGGKPGGGKFPGGPDPDFEAFLRRSQDSLRRWLGGQDNRRLFILLAVGAIVLWLLSGVYIVKPEELGVVKRLGIYYRTTTPGLNYALPFPIDSVATPAVTSINRVEVGMRSNASHGDVGVPEESLMLTGDENIVDLEFEVQWVIADAPKFLFQVRDPQETIKSVAESAMREVVGKSQISHLLTEGRADVQDAAKTLMQSILDQYGAGVQIVSVNLKRVDPPAAVLDAFRDVQTAEADAETARNQAETYRNDIIPRARGDAQKMVLDAEAYKQETVARAQGEAARFTSVYNEFKQAKDATKKRMYLETMEEILQNMNKLIVEKDGVIPYIPLDQLKPKTPVEAKP